MIIGVDYDGTIVEQEGRTYEDVTTPARFMPGAIDGLHSLQRAKHTLILFSARLSPGNIEDPMKRPLVIAGLHQVNWETWPAQMMLNRARVDHMMFTIAEHLPGVFAAATSDKCGLDLIIDNQAMRFGRGVLGVGWRKLAEMYGEW